MTRPLSERERELLDVLLSLPFDGVEDLRVQAQSAVVVASCACGCPSIDFYNEPGIGMQVRVSAAIAGSYDGLFLYTIGDHLGGIEYVGVSEEGCPIELPEPSALTIELA